MSRQLDHLILAAQDLDKLGALFEALGFTVGVQNRHDWGTINRIVQIGPSFLELLSVEDGFTRPPETAPEAPFAVFLADYLARHEGTAALVVAGENSVNDRARWLSLGLDSPGILNFGRTGTLPDGTTVELAFSLAFARSKHLPNTLFFSCHDRYPEYFWSDAMKGHANAVTRIESVSLVSKARSDAKRFLATFLGDKAPLLGTHMHSYTAGLSRVDVMAPETAARLYDGLLNGPAPTDDGIVAIHFACSDLAAARTWIEKAGVSVETRDGALHVPAGDAFGTVLVFAEDETAADAPAKSDEVPTA